MAYIPSKRRRTERNSPARVTSVGLPRSRGARWEFAPEQWQKERRRVRVVTLAETPAHALWPGRPHLPRSARRFPLSIERACTKREVGIEKTAASGMEERICMGGSRGKM